MAGKRDQRDGADDSGSGGSAVSLALSVDRIEELEHATRTTDKTLSFQVRFDNLVNEMLLSGHNLKAIQAAIRKKLGHEVSLRGLEEYCANSRKIRYEQAALSLREGVGVTLKQATDRANYLWEQYMLHAEESERYYQSTGEIVGHKLKLDALEASERLQDKLFHWLGLGEPERVEHTFSLQEFLDKSEQLRKLHEATRDPAD